MGQCSISQLAGYVAFLTVKREIKENPFIGKPLLRELFGKYSYRVGQYRIVYIIDKKDKIVKVLTAGHRSSVYI